jgi:glycosyltransferase involved in cell wall biosynthesis
VRLFSSVGDAAAAESWNWLLLHNVNDLLDSKDLDLPRVFLVHGTLSGRLLQDRSDLDRSAYLGKLRVLLDRYRCRIVYISQLKHDDWGLGGSVIPPGIDASAYGGYRGDREGLLVVSNHIRERGAVLGWETFATVSEGFPYAILGRNEGLACSRVSRDWEDLKEQYRSWRVYLYTGVFPFEDGYNLALLEAMATGMPAATLAHPTTPVRDRIEGVVAQSAAELRERVATLLRSPEDAFRLGAGARRRVETEFPLGRFTAQWSELSGELLRKAGRPRATR